MIKNNLSVLLGKHRMKMSELAEKANINKNTILSLYHDRSKRIDYEVLNKICKTLNCQPGDILEYVPDEDN